MKRRSPLIRVSNDGEEIIIKFHINDFTNTQYTIVYSHARTEYRAKSRGSTTPLFVKEERE